MGTSSDGSVDRYNSTNIITNTGLSYNSVVNIQRLARAIKLCDKLYSQVNIRFHFKKSYKTFLANFIIMYNQE